MRIGLMLGLGVVGYGLVVDKKVLTNIGGMVTRNVAKLAKKEDGSSETTKQLVGGGSCILAGHLLDSVLDE